MNAPCTPMIYPITAPQVRIMGRAQRTRDGDLRIGYPGVTVRIAFEGSQVLLTATCSSNDSILLPVVDGAKLAPLRLVTGTQDLVVAKALGPGPHRLDLVRQTETWLGVMTLESITIPDGALIAPTEWPTRKLLIIGDSVTGGEAAGRSQTGTTDRASTWDAHGSYGMRLGRALNAQVHLVSYGGRGLVRDWQGKTDVLNAPQFFELSVPEPSKPGESPLEWDHSAYIPDAIIVSLGTNDFNLALGTFPDEQIFVSTYVGFLQRLRTLYPNATLFITEGAIVNDSPRTPARTTLRHYLDQTVSAMADPRVWHLPSNHYPGDDCDAHPTGEQHQYMATDIEPSLRSTMGW